MPSKFRVVRTNDPAALFDDLDALREAMPPGPRKRPRTTETFARIPYSLRAQYERSDNTRSGSCPLQSRTAACRRRLRLPRYGSNRVVFSRRHRLAIALNPHAGRGSVVAQLRNLRCLASRR